MNTETNKGNCYICGRSFSKNGYAKHIISHQYDLTDKQTVAVIKVEDLSGKCWLYLDMPLNSTLKALDEFLREIWLECCGHMSAFYIKRYQEIGKSEKISSFAKGAVLRYEYDFGSTTELKITIVENSSRKKQKKSVRLLARNEAYEYKCQKCGEAADYIDIEEKRTSDNPFWCSACREKYGSEKLFLPVVNSPRMGECAYCGDYDVYEFDPNNSTKSELTSADNVFDELVLPEETESLLYRYFEAANNLYGMIPLYKLLEIYNSQNEPITEEQFLHFVDGIDFDVVHYAIIGEDEMYKDVPPTEPIKRELAAEYLYCGSDESYYEFKEERLPVSYYVPEKEKFLKYEDECYYEKTLDFISLRAFLRNQGYLTKERADEIADGIQIITTIEKTNLDFAPDEAMRLGLRLGNSSVYKEFMELCKNVDRNTRKHIYCGHTYNEVFA